jgi:hypothetical protein
MLQELVPRVQSLDELFVLSLFQVILDLLQFVLQSVLVLKLAILIFLLDSLLNLCFS